MGSSSLESRDGIIILNDDVADVHVIDDYDDEHNDNDDGGIDGDNNLRIPPSSQGQRRRCCRFYHWIGFVIALGVAVFLTQKGILMRSSKTSNSNIADMNDNNDDDTAITESLTKDKDTLSTMLDGTSSGTSTINSVGGNVNTSGIKTIAVNDTLKESDHDVVVNTTSNNGAIFDDGDEQDDDDKAMDDTSTTTNQAVTTSKNTTTMTTTNTVWKQPVDVVNPETGAVVISRYGTNYTLRSQRFPSIQQRLQVYLSNWYLPPCHIDDNAAIRYSHEYTTKQNQTMQLIDVYNIGSYKQTTASKANATYAISNHVTLDTIFYLDKGRVLDIVNRKTTNTDVIASQKQSFLTYGQEIADNLLPALQRIKWNPHNHKDMPPILLQYHHEKKSKIQMVDIPVIMHSRASIYPDDLTYVAMNGQELGKSKVNCTSTTRIPPTLTSDSDVQSDTSGSSLLSLQPIVWKFYAKKFYKELQMIDYADTTPYKKKKDIAVFRGTLNAGTWNTSLSDVENCYSIPRCNLVLTYRDSSYIDARLVEPFNKQKYGKVIHVFSGSRRVSTLTNNTSTNTNKTASSASSKPNKNKTNTTKASNSKAANTTKATSNKKTTSTAGANKTSSTATVAPAVKNETTVVASSKGSNTTSTATTTTVTNKTASATPVTNETSPATSTAETNTTSTATSTTVANKTSTATGTNTQRTKRIYLNGTALSIKELTDYKMIIMVEGSSDFGHELHLALYSHSVVLMPYPITTTTWLMEELLEPYVHFVPIKSDFSNLEHTVRWVLHHPKEAQYISFRARLWVEDLLLHPDSVNDEMYIQNTTLQKYRSLFYRA